MPDNQPTIQDIIGGYTPLSNNVVKILKLVKGALACKIFYTSNLHDRVCRMGLTRLSDELGIDSSTASKNIDWLIDNEYIERVKEHTATDPAHYRCTQKFYDLARGIDLINTGIDVINRGIDLINQEEESKEDIKEYMGASAENLEDIFGPKEIEPVQPPDKPLSQRIKDKDTTLLMAALGVTAKERASTTEQDLHHAGWHIGNENIRRAILDFLEATGLPIPAKPARGAWLKHAKEHLEEFTDLKALYKKAWREYKPQIDAGMIDITHPGALTKKMRAILQRKPESKPGLSQTNIDMDYYNQLLEQEKTRNGNPS